MGRSSSQAPRSAATALAVGYRRAASLARQVRMIVSRSRGKPGRASRGATGSSWRILVMTPCEVWASKIGLPVASS